MAGVLRKFELTWSRLTLALEQLFAIVRNVRRPVPMLLDLFKFRQSPYVARTRGKTPVEMEVRPGGMDRYVFYETIIRRDYFTLGNPLRAGDVVIDVGGNIGGFTIVAAQMVGPRGRVIAVEPEPGAFDQLVANVRRNGLGNVTARRAAVGAREGEVVMRCLSRSLYTMAFSDGDAPPADKPDIRVPVLPLEKLMDDEGLERCHFLKIDVEGGEYDILDGLSKEGARRIDRIAVEFHPAPGRRVEELERRLRELGYDRVIRHWAMFFASRSGGAG